MVPPNGILPSQQQPPHPGPGFDSSQIDSRYTADEAAAPKRPSYAKGRQLFDIRNVYAGYQNEQVLVAAFEWKLFAGMRTQELFVF